MANFSPNARVVLEARYLKKDSTGRVIETPDELVHRVATAVAEAERVYGGAAAVAHWQSKFLSLLGDLDFLPNSPTLMNAGTKVRQLSACYVLPVGDSLEEIFDSLKWMALIQQSGGGTGFSFSRLRPKGDVVATHNGVSSGPVSFLRIFDCATENIRQGGRRRGANMGILRVDHPDILEFVDCKREGQAFRNFNLSVGATDVFMQAVKSGGSYALIHPRTQKKVGELSARAVFSQIAHNAWTTGDPGLVFLDTIQRSQPTPALGEIEATNPCGEVPLLPYEACNLGSVHLGHMIEVRAGKTQVDWNRLGETVATAMRFLDNVIDISQFLSSDIDKMVRGNRKVGLGVMGFAELLIALEIPYASAPAVALAERIMAFMQKTAHETSKALADERGVFPNWDKSIYAKTGERLRNATCTSIAPTGTLGILANTSAGIEPLFALAYARSALDGKVLHEVNGQCLEYLRQHHLTAPEILAHVTRTGSLAGLETIPESARVLFATALDIPVEYHLGIQAAFQAHVDNAVSKTINLPESANEQAVYKIYFSAWERGLKGITIYRYGSRLVPVISPGTDSAAVEGHSVKCDPADCKL